MASSRLSFSYPLDMKKKVLEVAEEECRSTSSMIQIFIREGLVRRGKIGKAVKKPRKRIRKAERRK